MIQTDDQMLLAQQCVGNLRRVLLEARKVHSQQDYTQMAEPILLEIQQREQEILEYLSSGLEQPIAS
jgi:DNA-binding NarL/FixJ family response regulator